MIRALVLVFLLRLDGLPFRTMPEVDRLEAVVQSSVSQLTF